MDPSDAVGGAVDPPPLGLAAILAATTLAVATTLAAAIAYPALTGVYVMGFAAGIVHFIDAILAFVFWRQQPSPQS